MNSIWQARKAALVELSSLKSADYSGLTIAREVDIILRYLLQCQDLIVGPQYLTDTQLADFHTMIARRKSQEPLQHILGEAYFYGLTLTVGPGCFIPRPETEILVEIALGEYEKARVEQNQIGDDTDKPYLIYDLCAGSGAIILAVMKQIRERQESYQKTGGSKCRNPSADNGVENLVICGLAVEKSPEAISYTHKNLQRYAELASAITLVETDVTSFNPTSTGYSKANLILCNPPYVAPGDVYQPEARFDPEMALYGGGERGLEIPLAILENLENLLENHGTLIMEHAEHQGVELVNRARQLGFAHAETIRDLTGAERFLLATNYKNIDLPVSLR